MKRLLLMIALSLGASHVFAQSPLQVGEKQLNAGLGLFGKGTSLYAGVEFGVYEDITAGGEISRQSRTDHFGFGRIQYRGFGIGANANYHFNRILKIEDVWDVYAGLTLNYTNWNTEVTDFSGSPFNYLGAYSYNTGLGMDIQVGGRYFFSETFGVNLELGGMALSGGKVGITYKF
ncbi:MAG: hypothetical protein EOO90_12120 [Pedobacter sp.]|nr:MAG: hypothetical protein EOO90_12120 [Pedobacter sp.]